MYVPISSSGMVSVPVDLDRVAESADRVSSALALLYFSLCPFLVRLGWGLTLSSSSDLLRFFSYSSSIVNLMDDRVASSSLFKSCIIVNLN